MDPRTHATWRFGKTLGKALLDLEVVPLGRRRRLRFGSALLRSSIYAVPVLVGLVMRQIADGLAGSAPDAARALTVASKAVTVIACIWPLAALVWTSWRRPDKRTPWDRAAGTMVSYVRSAD